MRLIIYALLSLSLVAPASAELTSKSDRFKAALNGLTHSEPKVRFASLIALGTVAGPNSLEFKLSAYNLLMETDRRQVELAQSGQSGSALQEFEELTARKIRIIEILVTRSLDLSHHLRMYIRSTVGSGELDPHYSPKIIAMLAGSPRKADDQMLTGVLVKVMNLADNSVARAEDSRQFMTEPTLRQVLPATADLMMQKEVKDTDLLKRMSRLLKTFKIPREHLTAYMGRLRGKDCGGALAAKDI